MAEPEFSKELIVRCAKALDRVSDAYGWNDVKAVQAVLRESGHAELVAALQAAQDEMSAWNYTYRKSVHDQIVVALKKAGAL